MQMTDIHQSDITGVDHVTLPKTLERQRRSEVPMYDKLDLTKSSSVSIMSASFKKKGIALNRRGAMKVVRTSSAPDGRGKPSLQLHGYQGYAGGKN